MSRAKLSRSFAIGLANLLEGAVLNASAFCNRRLLARMVEDRVLARTRTGRTRAKISCPNPEALRNYLRQQLGIVDLDTYLEMQGREECDGEESLRATTSTKTLRTKSLQGFFIKTYSTTVQVGGVPLHTLPTGVEYFVSGFQALELTSEVLVVGVENPECFTKAERLLHLFPQKGLVFVLRYHSNRLIQWLESISNPYLHFGDFDPAGIAIYCNEYRSRLGNDRCRFFVPGGIEELIESGDPALFDQQAHLWPPKVDFQQAELADLVDVISRYAKGCEQERLLAL